MNILLFALYWLLGFFMAIAAGCALGMAICTVIAIGKTLVRPRNILFAGGYLLLSIIAALVAWSGFFIGGWIGDRTDYVGQTGLFVGAIFPGIFALAIIPLFAAIALKQTSR